MIQIRKEWCELNGFNFIDFESLNEAEMYILFLEQKIEALSQHDVSVSVCDCIEEYDLHRPLGGTAEYCTHCGLKAK